jgi:hypothetical protein
VFVACTACTAVFDIRATELAPDAPPPPDTDGDGVVDADDNCPDVPNDQADADQDGAGDRCDNCPLVANPEQELVGDDDAVGTACDPHPTVPGDCMVLFETFTRGADFGQTWALVGGVAATLEARDGELVVAAAGTDPVAFAPYDASGVLLAGDFDIQLRGRIASTTGDLFATSHVTPPNGGYSCGIKLLPAIGAYTVLARYSSGFGSSGGGGQLTAEPVNDAVVLRLTSPVPLATTANEQRIRCRGEYGLAAGFASLEPPTTTPPAGTAPGFMVHGADPATIEAIAFYRSQSEACAPALYR